MRNEDFEKAKKLIAETKLLTSIEKAEWLQLMPQMSDQQIGDFIAILLASRVPGQPAPSAQPTSTSQLQSRPLSTEKLLPQSRPFYEPELPEHAFQPKPQAVASEAISAQQKLSVSSVAPTQPVSQFPQHQQLQAYPTIPHLQNIEIPPVAKSTMPRPSAAVPAYQPAKPIVLKTPQDFAKLTAEIFHDQDPKFIADNIFKAVMEVGKINNFFSIVSALQQSPLYQTYLQVGAELLGNSQANSDLAYEHLQTKAEANNTEYLTLQEFEAFADLRAKLDNSYL